MSLTNHEIKVLNNMSNEHDSEVDLGTLLNERSSPDVGTPVKSVAATKTLTLTGVVKDGETVTINNPLENGTDVYEFLADDTQSKTTVGNIAVNIVARTAKAAVVLTLAVKPTVGDKTTLGTKEYTWVNVGSDNSDGEISIGADLPAAKLNFVAAVNGTDDHNDPHPLVVASDFATNDCTITALVGGTGGNSIASTEVFTSGSNVFAAVTLLLGTDCSAANAITDLVAAVTAHDTQGVGAVDGAGDTVVFTADDPGDEGNDIAIGETLPNATFAGGATALSGGVTGTLVFPGISLIMVDETYVHTWTGSIWTRFAHGGAY